jgi:hypothetical protein
MQGEIIHISHFTFPRKRLIINGVEIDIFLILLIKEMLGLAQGKMYKFLSK